MTVVLWKHPKISPRGQNFRPDAQILRPCLLVALPNALQRFGTSFGYVVFASMINALGDASTAAHTIANTVESAFYIPAYGMQTAAATLAGNVLGEGSEGKLKQLGRRILGIELILMLISGGLLFLLAPNMVRLFSKDQQVILLGITVLRMVALSEPFYGISIIVEGMLQGMGRTVFSLAVNLTGMWLIRIVGTYLCTQLFDMGLVAAWGCMIGHNLLLFCVYSFYYCSGRWNPFRKIKK
jgi:Na+-driven multidrug efflux pump